MTNAGNVASTFVLVGQADSRNFAQSRIGLLGRCGPDTQANAALLRAPLQDGHVRFFDYLLPSLADQLIDRGHGTPPDN
jgi:hypothetical protein